MISPKKHHSHDHLHNHAVLCYQHTFKILYNCPCLTQEAAAWVQYVLCCVVLCCLILFINFIIQVMFFGTMEFSWLNLKLLLQWYMKSEKLLHMDIQTTGEDRRKFCCTYIVSFWFSLKWDFTERILTSDLDTHRSRPAVVLPVVICPGAVLISPGALPTPPAYLYASLQCAQVHLGTVMPTLQPPQSLTQPIKKYIVHQHHTLLQNMHKQSSHLLVNVNKISLKQLMLSHHSPNGTVMMVLLSLLCYFNCITQ